MGPCDLLLLVVSIFVALLMVTPEADAAFIVPANRRGVAAVGKGGGAAFPHVPRTALRTHALRTRVGTGRTAIVRLSRPEDEDDEEERYAAMRRQQQRQEFPAEDDYLRRIGEEGEENYEAGRGLPPPVSYQLQFSIFDDLWPSMSRIWKSVVLLDREGTKRRSAQMTVISVSVMSASLGLLFLALLPAGFIHGPDPSVVKVRPTYNSKTYINPDKVLEDDFYRAGNVVSWENLEETDDDF